MRRNWKFLLVVIVFFSIFIFVRMPVVLATCDYNISACQSLYDPGKTYCLNQSIENYGGSCISIEDNNITFDGQGFTIDGLKNPASVGIATTGATNNITIKNVTLKEWEDAIQGRSSNSLFENIIITNVTYGIEMQDYNGTTVRNCLIGSVTEAGVRIVASSNNNISYNNISSVFLTVRYGLTFSSSNNNTVVGNRLTSLNFSMTFTSSNNNTVQGNVIENSLNAGFQLTNSNSTSLRGNQLTDCQAAGFELINSQLNNLTENVIDNVTNSGFKLISSHNNTFLSNNVTKIKSSGINLSLSNYNNLTDNKFTNPETTTSATGISLYSSSNNKINNNEMKNLTSGGVYLKNSNGNQLMNNSFYVPRTVDTVIAIWLSDSSDNNVSGGLFSGGLVTTRDIYPMILLDNNSDYNKIEEVIIPISYEGVYIKDSNNNTLSRINMWAVDSNIKLINASNNTLENSNFSRYSYYGPPYFYKSDSNSLHNRGTNVLFNSTSGVLANHFLNETYVDFFGDNFDFRESNISHEARGWIGKVFLFTIRGPIVVNTIEFNVSYTHQDLAKYHIDNESSLNMKYYSSGWNNITLSGVNTTENYVWSEPSSAIFSTEKPIAPFGHFDYPPEINLIYPSDDDILISGEINFSFNATDDVSSVFNCSLYLDDSLNATNSTTRNATTTHFNVTGISYGKHEWFVNCSDGTNQTNISETRSFTIGSFVSDCGVLNSAGRTYLMNRSLHSDTTCFTISADNITLNCAGYDISYGEGGVSGYAVTSAPNSAWLTVKNCNITEGNLSGNSKYGIIFVNSNNSHIHNNTITLIGATNRGVSLNGGYSHEVYDNIITSTGLAGSKGILFSSDMLCIIENNTIQVTGDSGVGISLQTTNSTNVTNNSVIASGATSYGIRIQGENNILYQNNFTGSPIGLKIDQPNNVLIENDFNNTKISFSQYSGAFEISRASEFPADPPDVAGISKYANITNISAGSWINITIHYDDDELGAVNESALEIWRYNGTNWTNLTSHVDITDNYVYSNITNFSTFGLFGGEYTSVNAPENLSIYLMDDDSDNVFLNWSEVSGATGYYIWYSDNVTWILQLNETNSTPANQTLTGSSNTTWNDTTANATQKRFYAVAAYLGEARGFAEDRVGKHTLNIIGPRTNNSLLAQPLTYNTSIKLVVPENDFAYVVTYDKYGIYDPYYRWFDLTNGGVWKNSSSIEEDLNLTSSLGYYFTTFDSNENFTTIGKIPTGNTTRIILGPRTNNTIIGFESYTNESLSELVVPENDFAYVASYDQNGEVIYRWYDRANGGIWKNMNGEEENLDLTAGLGYYFTTFDSDVNVTYERNPY